ncbi:MAG: choice-of-anchor Q domain-containing protein, partial [Kiritimatiellales bacterium]
MQWDAGESVEFSAGNLTNGTALLIHTDGLNTDFDSDGVRDVWETKWFGNLNTVINGSEFISQSNRFTYAEAAYLDLNPNTADTDGDGLSDTYEVEHGLNPVVQQDSDGDGMPDLFETAQGLDSADSADALADDDGDGFPNVYEYRHDTDLFESNSVPLPDRYVSLTGQHIAPFTNSATAATNLQAVLLAAAPYDIILVADGTYTGAENRNLDFLGKPLMLLSENGPTNCILDCENENRGFYLKNNAGSVIQGIQILQGFSGWDTSPGNGLGGAVCCINVNLLFENCCFLSNTAVDAGGVVYAENSSIIFKNSVFKDNGTDDPYLWGGLCCFPGSSFEGSSIEIFGCTITGTLGDEGIVFNGSDFLLQNNVFSNNVCCVLDGDDSTGSINNCVFVENQSSYRSGGAFFSDSDVMFANCVFKNNSVESSGTQSGALFLWGGALLAQNCLFSENSSEAGVVNLYQGFIWLENCTLFSNQCPALCNSVLGDLIVRNTILWGNESGSYDTDQWGLDIEFSCLPETVGTNNIHVDPMLISETGGLLPNSPCIDRSSDLIAPATDMQGTPRWDHPWRSNGVDSSIADIGAFEFTDSDTDADGLGDKWEIYYFTNITFSAGSEDFDSDGLSTSDEYHLNTNPTLADTDGDGLSDGAEVNSYGTNPLSTDSDGDGLSDYAEINSYGTNPLFADSDNDGLPDGWEVASSLNPLLGSDASADADSDGLSNLAEYTLGTGFQSSDSDSDGIPDGWEVSNNLNPLVDDSASDPDSDGLSNLAEYNNGVNSTDPQDTDSDDDGMPNAWESTHGLDLSTNEASGDPDGDGLTNLQEYQAQTNPQVADTDDDMLNDGEEISIYHTNPLLRDTDGDGYTDGAEIQQGRDPLVADSLYSPFLYSLSVDADDNGQLNIDEAHRLPMFTVNVGFDYDQYFSPPLTNYPPNDYYAVPSDLLNFLFQGAAAVNPLWMVSLSRATNYSWVSWLSQSSPQQVQSKTFMGNSGDVYSTNDIYSVSFPESCRVLGYGMVLSSHFSSDASGHIYPYSSDYSVEKGRAGAFSRRMSVFLSDGSADTNKMGLVVFKQMVIHSNAPTPHIYLSASPDVHLYRASTGQPITFYERGEPWDGSEDIDDYNQSKPGFSGIEDIGNELRSGDLAILVEGIAPSSPPNQTADKVIDEWFGRYPPFYGLPHNPTTQGSWGTYVGLCCKEDEDRYPAFANDMLRFSVEIKPEIHLIPDWNRDRQIDNTDKTWNTNSSPYRFWVNDDSDSGDIAEGDSDIPGQTGSWLPGSRTPNCKDQKVNGRSDLTDFFPVWLDIASALTNYPPANGIEYRLSQAGSAVQFVYTDLTASDAGDYLITDVSSCGPSFNQNVYQADTLLIPESGVELNSAFLDRIAANPDKGVLLIEAIDVLVEKTDILNAPLLLTVVSNNTILAYTQLPLSLSGVEQMFRHKNLRAEIGGDEQVPLRDTAPNWPDSLCSTTNLFFLHGVNTTEQGARGWQSEFFKRFYWSGSKARFHGITWYGDKGSDANYQENANHAFQTALYLKDYVSSVSGTKIMLAHSLGNIVVSSAIQDYGMSVSKYLMLDAAVASEAFDASMFNAATNNNPMLHAGWREYEPQAWSVNFHNLYSPPDLRAALTWQNRFAAVVSVAYNFYNSEDEVFEIHPDSVSTLTGVDFDYLFIPDDFEHYTWQKQEVFKGRDSSWLPGSLGSTKWWGWGFEKNWLGQTVSPEEANGLSTNELKNSPVFRHSPDWYIHVDNLTTDAVNEMLAMGLPAMSPSAGQVSVVSIQNNGGGNFDISTLKNGWPRNHETYLARWLHSDCRDVAYLYTYRLFDELVTEGVLK